METKSDNKISAFLNLSVSIAVFEGVKQKLQKILISLLTFNAVSPTIFLNSERYLLAVQNGFAQAAQSWDAASGTYLPPSSGSDLSWKQTISLGWQKRQAVLNKVKSPKVETLEDKLSKMSRAELEEEYGDVIQAYKRFTNMGQGDTILAKWDMNDLKLLWKRYNEVKDDHLGLLPSELAKVDPKFKKRIDAMDQEAIEEAYPELKTLISMAHVNPYAQLFKSETERANYDYLLDRYFLLDSQKMLSWRDPAFQTKYDYYIIEEGINPFTGKPATQEEINRAKNIKKVRAFTESLQLASSLYTSYVGYNQYYNKPYTTFSDVFSKVKGKVPFFNRKPVIPKVETNVKTITEPPKTYDRERILRNIEESKIARESSNFKQYVAKEESLIESWNRNASAFKMYNLDDLANLKHTENFTEKSLSHIFEGDLNKKGRAGGYHYDMIEGTTGSIIEGTKSSVLNDAGVYEAKVEVNGTLKKANGGKSTFFPDHMSPQEVVDAINEAYNNKIYQEGSRGVYVGESKGGIKIRMILTDNGKIITAYPIVSK
ncbi:EndoU domain-containing protein [Streptococcus lactarius]|nr:EndoU domain-containing protein [Streptococcus lactarius]